MAQFQRNKYKAILRQDFLDYINRTFWITKKARCIRGYYALSLLYLTFCDFTKSIIIFSKFVLSMKVNVNVTSHHKLYPTFQLSLLNVKKSIPQNN